MIEKFNDIEMRDTAVIYGSNLKQIKEMYAINPETAGELAISIIEVAVTGQMSTNNPLIRMALANFEDASTKNKVKYEKKKEAQREARIEKLRLREIAKLLKRGVSQKEIAKIIGKAPSSISDAVRILKTEFPELLNDSENLTEYSGVDSEILSEDSENSVNSDFKFGEFLQNSDEFGPDNKIPELQRNSEDSENSSNSDHDNVNDNDNVNVNDNVTRVFPSENTLETISLEELNRMGAEYTLDDEGVATFITGYKVKVKFEF